MSQVFVGRQPLFDRRLDTMGTSSCSVRGAVTWATQLMGAATNSLTAGKRVSG